MNLYYYLYNNQIEKQKEKAGHQAAYALLSYVLREEYGIFPLPEIEKGRYGKPYFTDYQQIHFNLSHCDGMAACVTAEYEVGIDVERKRHVTQALWNKVLTENEKATLQRWGAKDLEMGFLQYWTLKESFIKAIGRGLSFPLADVEFAFKQGQIFWALHPSLKEQEQSDLHLFSVKSVSDQFLESEKKLEKRKRLSFTNQNQISSNQKEWQFFQTFLEGDYLLSVCFPVRKIL